MKDTDQTAAEAAIRGLRELNPRFDLYRNQDPTFRQNEVNHWKDIIQSAIEKATREHQEEHDRLQGIIEKDTMALMVEREKSRVLGNLVDGLRTAHGTSAVADASEEHENEGNSQETIKGHEHVCYLCGETWESERKPDSASTGKRVTIKET